MEQVGITLEESADRVLTLVYQPAANATPVSAEDLVALLGERGYGALRLDMAALQQAAQRISQGASFKRAVGQRIDAAYKVQIAASKLSASIVVTPAQGGTAVSSDAACAAVAAAGVVSGVQHERLAEAIAAATGEPVEIAIGQAPVPGIDGWLEPLVTVNQQRHPQVDERGHVNFRDLGEIPTVRPGGALMRRHPPQPGTPGRNVLGTELLAAHGKDAAFAVRLQGVAADAEDPDLLRATVTGQPILLRDGVSVEEILRLDSVDVESGNVRFGGSVIIKGDVLTGMRIEVDGDVTVEGVIEAAEVIAGGDIFARGGVVGSKPASHDGGQQTSGSARLAAGGNVKIRYAENAAILAEQSVFVDEALIECDVTAVDRVEVGKPGKGKGHVLGGFVRATLCISAEYLGGPGSGQTRVFAGVNPLLQKAIEKQRQRMNGKLNEHTELSKVVKILKTRPDRQEMLDKARATLKKVSEEIAEIMAEEKRLSDEMRHADEAEILVSSGVYAGTMVAIGKKSRFVTEDCGSIAFRLLDGELVSGDLPR